jgi:regulator of PEP synthase PpsR (kinase-PPPase family)
MQKAKACEEMIMFEKTENEIGQPAYESKIPDVKIFDDLLKALETYIQIGMNQNPSLKGSNS